MSTQSKKIKVKAPRCAADISRGWLEEALSHYEAKTKPGASVHVTGFTVNPGAKPGENFGGEVVKILVEGEVTIGPPATITSTTTAAPNPPSTSGTSHPNTTTTPVTTTTTTTPSTTTTTPSITTTTDSTTTTTDSTTTGPPSTTTTTPSPSTTTITYNLFAKFLLGSAVDQQFIRIMNVHHRELLIYSDIVAELNAFQAKSTGDKYRINIPEYVYGLCTDDEYVLVMRDLSSDGYVVEDKRLGLDLPHIMMVVNRLAYLHAISFVLYQEEDFLKKYPSFVINDKSYITFLGIVTSICYDNLIKATEEKKDKYGHILSKLKPNKDAYIQKFCNMASGVEKSKLMCFAHGDLWTNNLMFKNEMMVNGESKPLDIMFIDWTNAIFRDPLLDLQYLIYSSTTLSLRRSHLEVVLRHYHSTFTAALTDLGARLDHWDFEDFMGEWRRTRTFGWVMGAMLSMVTLTQEAKDVKRGKISSNEFVAKMQIKLAKAMAPKMVKLSTTPLMVSLIKAKTRKAFAGLAKEVMHSDNEVLQTRVFDILTEAYDEGALDI